MAEEPKILFNATVMYVPRTAMWRLREPVLNARTRSSSIGAVVIFKILPFIVFVGAAARFLASFAAANAYRKKLKAQQAGRLNDYYAQKEAFWQKVDRISIVVAAIAAVWYVGGVLHWLLNL